MKIEKEGFRMYDNDKEAYAMTPPAKKKLKIKWTRYPRRKKELMCEHGVGHEGIHGCDGCCSDPSFKEAWKKIFKEEL